MSLCKKKQFKSDIDSVRESISLKPDLVRLKPTKITPVEPLVIDQVEVGPFSGSIEFGFLYEQGNQATKAVKGRLILDHEQPEQCNINSDLDF